MASSTRREIEVTTLDLSDFALKKIFYNEPMIILNLLFYKS